MRPMRRMQASGKIAEMGEFSLPPLEYDTRAMWVDVPTNVQADLEARGIDFLVPSFVPKT